MKGEGPPTTRTEAGGVIATGTDEAQARALFQERYRNTPSPLTRQIEQRVIGGDWGATFRYADEGSEDPYSLLSPFKQSTDYMDPSTAGFMINLRVDDLDGMLAQLQEKGIEILGRQDEDYGNFAWILDCDGVKLELWQQKGPAPA